MGPWLNGRQHNRRYTSGGVSHAGQRDPKRVPYLLRGTRPSPGPVLVADLSTPQPAPDDGRYGPVHPVLPGRGATALPASGERAEVLPRHGHRERRAYGPAPDILRDARQFL